MANQLLPAPDINTQVREVPVGATVTLRCNSNDDQHNFMFWQLGQNQIIGPGNDYDQAKYKYEVLSGKLIIKAVKPDETGFYRCVSKHIDKENFNVGAVEMVVKQHAKFQKLQAEFVEENDDGNDYIEVMKIICIVVSLIVMIICAVIFYRLKKAEQKRNKRLVMLADDDDEGSGDEIYNRTTTVINDNGPGPSRTPTDHITGIDNQGLDTDFNSAFEQIAINMANRNLV